MTAPDSPTRNGLVQPIVVGPAGDHLEIIEAAHGTEAPPLSRFRDRVALRIANDPARVDRGSVVT